MVGNKRALMIITMRLSFAEKLARNMLPGLRRTHQGTQQVVHDLPLGPEPADVQRGAKLIESGLTVADQHLGQDRHVSLPQ